MMAAAIRRRRCATRVNIGSKPLEAIGRLIFRTLLRARLGDLPDLDPKDTQLGSNTCTPWLRAQT